MCTLIAAVHATATLPLVIAANRDEATARPARSAGGIGRAPEPVGDPHEEPGRVEPEPGSARPVVPG